MILCLLTGIQILKCLLSCGHDNIPFLHYYLKLLWKIKNNMELQNTLKLLQKKALSDFLTTGWNYAIALKLVKRKIFRISFFSLVVFLPPFLLACLPFCKDYMWGNECSAKLGSRLASQVFNIYFCFISCKSKSEAICLPTTTSFTPIMETEPPTSSLKGKLQRDIVFAYSPLWQMFYIIYLHMRTHV